MKKFKLFFSFIIFFIILQFFNISHAIEEKNGIENFPSSYQPYLMELQRNYPNWRFIALYTGLDWQSVINEENQFGKNLVPKSYSDRWKNTNPR